MAAPTEEDLSWSREKVVDYLNKGDLSRLTVRLLAERVEQKRKLPAGSLRAVVRDVVMASVAKLSKKRAREIEASGEGPAAAKRRGSGSAAARGKDESTMSPAEKAVHRLTRLATAAGCHLQVLKKTAELGDEEKAGVLRERLRALGVLKSNVPTRAEIEDAERERKRRQEMEGIDSSLILDGSAKRRRDGSAAPSAPSAKARGAAKGDDDGSGSEVEADL